MQKIKTVTCNGSYNDSIGNFSFDWRSLNIRVQAPNYQILMTEIKDMDI